MAVEEVDKELLGEGGELSRADGDDGDSGGNAEGHSDLPPELFIEESPPQKGGAVRLLFILVLIVGIVGVGLYLLGQSWLSVDLPDENPRPARVEKMRVPVRPISSAPPEAVKEEVVPKETIARVERSQAEVVVEPQPKSTPGPLATSTFRVGSKDYLYAGELRRDISRIEKLGYEVERSSRTESHEVTRLLVGVYSKPLAKKRLARVKKIDGGAFLVAEKGRYAVYAGSFLSVDKARRFADNLYQQGVRVKEVRTRVDLPHTTLTFGHFATRQEAERVVAELTKKGVTDLKARVGK